MSWVSNKKYDLNIYAVYTGEDYSVKLFAYPARRNADGSYRCAVYLNTHEPYCTGMIKLPTNILYKIDFERPIKLVNSTVTYYLKKEDALYAAERKRKKRSKEAAAEIEKLKEQITALQERLLVLEDAERIREGEFVDIKYSMSRQDASEYT